MSKVTWDFGEWSGAVKLWFYKKCIIHAKSVDTGCVDAKSVNAKSIVDAKSVDAKSVDNFMLRS